jgi:hypothetical protein
MKYFLPKKLFPSSRKYDLGFSSRIRILIFTHPGYRISQTGAKRHRIQGPRSRIWIRNTVIDRVKRSQNKDRQMQKMFSIQNTRQNLQVNIHNENVQGPYTRGIFVFPYFVEELSAIFRPGLNEKYSPFYIF